MIRIDSEIHKKAQELGINVSKTCENLLKIYLEGIEQVQNRIRQQTNKDFSFSRGFLFQKEKVEWTGRDLYLKGFKSSKIRVALHKVPR